MSRKKTIIIGSKVFEFQKDAISFYKDILNSYGVGDELTPEDFELIEELLKNHPQAKEKFGDGISKLSVELDGYGG